MQPTPQGALALAQAPCSQAANDADHVNEGVTCEQCGVRTSLRLAVLSPLPRESGRHTPNEPSKLVEQCLGLLQNGRIEALSEPAIGRSEEIAGGIALALLAPEPGKTDRGAQLPELRALLLRDVDR